MKIGDLIKCGDETGIILDFQAKPPEMFDEDFFQWLNILWPDGDIEGISIEDVDRVINASG